MRLFVLAAAVFMIAAVSYPQADTPPTSHIRSRVDTVTTDWDSVHIGHSSLTKFVQFTNAGEVNLHVTLGDDTTSGSYTTLGPTESLYLSRGTKAKYVRTKAASGTVIRRVWWAY